MKIPVSPAIISFFVYWIYRLITLTLRFELINTDAVSAAWSRGEQLVFACWHNEFLTSPHLLRGRPWLAIVSASKDGQYLAGAMHYLGVLTVRGSSSRLGMRALVNAIRHMKKNKTMQGVITIDGPRGPRHEVKEGVIILAQKSGALLVPLRTKMHRAFILKNAWDKFQIPLPFSRCTIVTGTPYAVREEKLDQHALDQEKQKLQKILDTLLDCA